MHLRPATPDDVPVLAALCAAAIHTAGPTHYTAAQIDAWAAFTDEPRFVRFVLDPHTIVAHEEGRIIGFAGLADDGHVTALYVHPEHMRRGVGSALMRAVLARAKAQGIARLYTEASVFSRPVFARHGFTRDAVETVERHGVLIDRDLMVCELDAEVS